jgi:hypothetical protein
MCVCKPVDAAHYPGESGSVYAGANKTGSNANLRIFENGVEAYRYNIPSSYDYGWVRWRWSGGYHADMEFAFYNGNTKRWSRTCMVGDEPEPEPDPEPACVIVETGSLRVLTTGYHEYRSDAVIKNNSDSEAVFAIIPAGTDKNTSASILDPGAQKRLHCFFDDPDRNNCLDFEVIINRSAVCAEFTMCWDDQPHICPEKATQSDCELASCYWYGGGCHSTPEPDPCEGVVCDDYLCVGADKYSLVCPTDGPYAGQCVKDTLIEANSPDCPGYVPPYDNEPDDEPDDGEPDDGIPPVDDDIPPVDDISELATDISSLLGDIKPFHVIIAVIIMIIIGLLS